VDREVLPRLNDHAWEPLLGGVIDPILPAQVRVLLIVLVHPPAIVDSVIAIARIPLSTQFAEDITICLNRFVIVFLEASVTISRSRHRSSGLHAVDLQADVVAIPMDIASHHTNIRSPTPAEEIL